LIYGAWTSATSSSTDHAAACGSHRSVATRWSSTPRPGNRSPASAQSI
jgi:hypothetical protein